jgi:hypothetical protein
VFDFSIGKLREGLLGAAVAAAFVAGCVSGPSYPPSPPYSNQPHMQNALVALQNGLSELQQAEANKGGHRERAIQLVKEAIEQVEMGIQFAAEHGG